MWRGVRCLRALWGVRAAGTGAAVGRRGLRVVDPGAPSLLPGVASMARRRASGVNSSELQDDAPSTFSIDHMVSLLRQENAKDICVIQVPPEMRYSDYFIIVSGSSTRHLHAMAQYLVKMYKHLKTDSKPHVLIEGRETDNWLCIDFGNIMVHFMLPETREIYELEKLWTLRAYDDQLTQMVPESLPEDFIFGMSHEEQ